MKIQLFYDSRYNEESIAGLQDEVNEFTKDKDVIDIKFTSEGAENGHSYMLMVIYK
ncbi:hypothetical protein QGM71_01030 [Virgibacillus sp. C22-A2]|uniref:Sporulation protein Cse60 n=1 Tax=Virgibacillus tibetensis TaxID=3042313 RepID=A0ABU6KA54_9BACI|nr:hypothetical protein [Virgibacillus sp. C22-A2]